MKSNHWLTAFIVALAVDLAAIILEERTLQMICKPVIVLSLALHFYMRTAGRGSHLRKYVLLALGFSWLGDILLMFSGSDEMYFIAGLTSFLIAHIFYIIFFHLVKKQEKIRSRIWPLVIVSVYYAGLMFILSPYLGDLIIPVRVYGIVISIMFMLAMHMIFLQNRVAGKLLLAGALLFVISDSILAADKFYSHFPMAGFLVMATYGAAQFMLVYGATQYILRNRNTFESPAVAQS